MSLRDTDVWTKRGDHEWSAHPYRIVGARDPDGTLRYNVYVGGLFIARHWSPEEAREAAAEHAHE